MKLSIRLWPNLLIGFCPFLLFGVLLLWNGISGYYDNQRFSVESKYAEATVVGLGSSGGARAGSNRIDYLYRIGDIQISTKERLISSTDWHGLKVGDSIPIQYLAARPEVSRIDLYDTLQWTSDNDLLSTIAGILFVGVGMLLIFAPNRFASYICSKLC